MFSLVTAILIQSVSFHFDFFLMHIDYYVIIFRFTKCRFHKIFARPLQKEKDSGATALEAVYLI